MDFTTISKKLENSSIKSPVEFHHALHHAFLNIAMSLDHGNEMYRFCVKFIDDEQSLSLPVEKKKRRRR